MTATVARLVTLARLPRSRIALSLLLATLAVGFGVALLATAGYLISRAAEQPPILSLTVTIVIVRFLGLGRPIARYADRLASHDLALRGLGRIRARVYERIEPLAPGQLEGYRRGDLLARMVGDVDALQGLYVRGLGPPVVALVVGTACVAVTAVFLPVAAVVLAVGLLVAGVAVPWLSAVLARTVGRRQAVARGALTAELVELLRGAPELVVYGQEEATLARVRELDRELTRSGRRDALVAGLGDALTILVTGLTTAGVLAVGVSSTASGGLDPVLVATLTLLALASFDAVAPLAATARELSATIASGRRVLALVDRSPAIEDPELPLPAPPRDATVALDGVTAAYRGEQPDRPRSPPDARAGPQGRSGRSERIGQDDGDEAAAPLPRPGRRQRDDRRPRPPRVRAGGRSTSTSGSRARRRMSSTPRSARTSASPARARRTSTSTMCSAARASTTG